jgi:predicted neuraminidase
VAGEAPLTSVVALCPAGRRRTAYQWEGVVVRAQFIFEQAPFASCHASTIVEPRTGEFLAAWFGGTDEGAKDVAIWMARSTAGGWSKPEKVADEPGVPCWNPVLFRERAGTVFLFYKVGTSPQTWSGFYRASRDSGMTWGPPVLLPAGILGPIKNKPIQLKAGRIVAGTSVESYRAWSAWVEISDDSAQSWQRHGPIVVPGENYGIIQPTVFETSDGSLRMLTRATQRIGQICTATSRDGGVTWTIAAPTDLPNPNSGIDAVRLADGRVVLCHNPTHTGRTPLVLSVSKDDGVTWLVGPTLESESGEYSYPAIIQAASGEIHVTYTWKRIRVRHWVLQLKDLA